MSKKIIQDIVAKKKRVPIPTPKKPSVKITTPPPARKTKNLKKAGMGKIVFITFSLFLILVVCIKIVSAFSGAIIKLVPHQEILDVDTLIKAGATYDIAYETMEVSSTKEKSVDATGVEEANSRAKGVITIYNAYSSQSQSLIANTRFESSDGKIYRIQEKIIVPGAKIENGEIVPSSIKTTIYADEAGEEYNIGLSDFKIPGFKGGARYEKFYAKSETPLEGGFRGVVPIISEEEQTKIREELEVSIKNELLEKAKSQIPEDFLFYEKALQISFTEDKNVNNPVGAETNPRFTTKETGTLTAFLVPRDELTTSLVKKYLGEEFVGKVKIDNLEELNFTLISYDNEGGLVIFKISGKAIFVWIIEEEQLKNALLAQPKELESVFESFPAIDQASVVFKPFWWKFFPEKASKISVEQAG